MVDEMAPWDDSSRVIETRQTDVFKVWFTGLRDRRAVQVIAGRIARVQRGALGDVQSVGDGVSEMRIPLRAWLSPLLHLEGRGFGDPALRRRQVHPDPRHLAGKDSGDGGLTRWP